MDACKKEPTDAGQGESEVDNVIIKEEIKCEADEDSEEVLPEQLGDTEVKTEQFGGKEDDENEEDAQEFAENFQKQQDNEELQAFVDELLKEKIKFNTGEEEFIFSRGPKYSDDMWPVNCHVCRKGNFVTLMQIKNHVKGGTHRLWLAKVLEKPQAHEQYMRPYRQNPSKNRGMLTPISISPGEVIWELTEEDNDKIIKEEDFKIQQPPEDVMKVADGEPMHEYNKKFPLIGLCYLHKMRVKSGNIHYYCLLCNVNLPKEGYQHVIAPRHQFKYIEKHFPTLYKKVAERLKIEQSVDLNTCVSNIFRKLYRKIENAKGFKEIVFVDHSHFYKYKNKYLNRMLKFVDHYDEKTILITEHEVNILIRKSINRIEFIKPDPKVLGQPQREDKGKHMKRVLRELCDTEEAAWQKYHFIMIRELEDLNQDYQNFERNPSSHPAYFNEERTFFSQAGNDPQILRNLKTEWMDFWSRRLRHHYDSDLAERKLRLKTELRLRTEMRTPSPTGPLRKKVPPNYMQSTSEYDGGYTEVPNTTTNVIDTQLPSEPLGVISVLRLFTAIEDQLGTLGPKAVEFLSKAVLAEKNNQNPNDLMMDSGVYVFFVTVTEKLKGQIYANIVDENRIPAVNRAISDAKTLLDMFEEYSRRTGKHPVSSSPVTTIHQAESTNISDQPNQFVSSTQSDSHNTRTSQYTGDNNGSANWSNKGGLNYPRLNLNPYQTRSGSNNMYSSSGGNEGNNYSTSTIVSSHQTSRIGNQFPSGQQYDTNFNKNDSFSPGSGNSQGIGHSSRSTPKSTIVNSQHQISGIGNQFASGQQYDKNFNKNESGNLQGIGQSSHNTSKSFGEGSRNFSETGYSAWNIQNSGAGSRNSQRTRFSNRNTPNTFRGGQRNFRGSGYQRRGTSNTFRTGSTNFNNY